MLTTSQAAKRLGVSVQTVRNLCNEGRLPCYRPGHHRRIAESDIDAYLESVRSAEPFVPGPVEFDNSAAELQNVLKRIKKGRP